MELVCPCCGAPLPGAVPQVRCQHCKKPLDGFPVLCPHCGERLGSATATHYLGQTVPFSIKSCVTDHPEQAKKKISPYLKLCDYFLCNSELALMQVNSYQGVMDSRSLEAIDDVLETLQQHIINLTLIRELIATTPFLTPTTKKVDGALKKCRSLLQKWQASDFTGPSA
ncbi:hypothetical protein C4J81_07845 [Deltaproteobacteria bacterium Smac51]|nr:hypothetical protein C4J81_07845 [Deltaproteobacteria bacterium Smac51]